MRLHGRKLRQASARDHEGAPWHHLAGARGAVRAPYTPPVTLTVEISCNGPGHQTWRTAEAQDRRTRSAARARPCTRTTTARTRLTGCEPAPPEMARPGQGSHREKRLSRQQAESTARPRPLHAQGQAAAAPPPRTPVCAPLHSAQLLPTAAGGETAPLRHHA